MEHHERKRLLSSMHDGTSLPNIRPVGKLAQHKIGDIRSRNRGDECLRLNIHSVTVDPTRRGRAVDILMQQLYQKHDLGDPSKAGFAAKVGTAAKRLSIFGKIKDELLSIGMKKDDATIIVDNLQKSGPGLFVVKIR